MIITSYTTTPTIIRDESFLKALEGAFEVKQKIDMLWSSHNLRFIWNPNNSIALVKGNLKENHCAILLTYDDSNENVKTIIEIATKVGITVDIVKMDKISEREIKKEDKVKHTSLPTLIKEYQTFDDFKENFGELISQIDRSTLYYDLLVRTTEDKNFYRFVYSSKIVSATELEEDSEYGYRAIFFNYQYNKEIDIWDIMIKIAKDNGIDIHLRLGGIKVFDEKVPLVLFLKETSNKYTNPTIQLTIFELKNQAAQSLLDNCIVS